MGPPKRAVAGRPEEPHGAGSGGPGASMLQQCPQPFLIQLLLGGQRGPCSQPGASEPALGCLLRSSASLSSLFIRGGG